MNIEHKWRLVIGKGSDVPNDSLDEVFWCERCGTVKHDYRHGGGLRSPNYPLYYIPGLGPTPNSQHCVGERETIAQVLEQVRP